MRSTVVLLCLLGLALAAETPVMLEILPDESPHRAKRWVGGERDVLLRLRRTGPEAVRGTVGLPIDNGAPAPRPFDLSEAEATEIPMRAHVFPLCNSEPLDVVVEVNVGETAILSGAVWLRETVEWRIAGPFPGGVEVDHDRALPPAEDPDRAEYELLSGERIAWRRVPVEAFLPDGTVKFDRVWPGMTDATAYAAATVFAGEPGKARLLVGSDDAVKVWVNGARVHDHRAPRACVPAEDSVEVYLAAGENRILLKVGQTWGEWAFWVDFDTLNGPPGWGLEWEIAYRVVPVTDPRISIENGYRPRDTLSVKWRSARPSWGAVRVALAPSGRARPVAGGIPALAPLGRHDREASRDDIAPGVDHHATVSSLEPGRRYLLSVSPAGAGDWSDPIAIRVGPPAKKAMVLALRVAVVVFTNVVSARDADRPGAAVPVPKEEVERTIRECDLASRFFFVNSGCRLFLQNEFFVDERPYVVPAGSPYGVGLSPGGPENRALAELLSARRKTTGDYDR
jgi:hypothetical protein